MKTQTFQNLKKQWTAIVSLLIITGVAISSCSTGNDDDNGPIMTMVEYSGDVIPSGDDVTTSASGTTTATFNSETRELTYEVVWTGLSTAVVAMHFHDDGPVIHDIDGWDAETSGNVSGTVTFSEEESADLAAGDVYVQIHTEDYPGGEVVYPLSQSGNNNDTTPPNDDY